MKTEFLRTLPAFFAIAILILAPAVGIISFRALMSFAESQGYATSPATRVVATFGALWEMALLVLVSKDLLKD